jgi:hypothetical protein
MVSAERNGPNIAYEGEPTEATVSVFDGGYNRSVDTFVTLAQQPCGFSVDAKHAIDGRQAR